MTNHVYAHLAMAVIAPSLASNISYCRVSRVVRDNVLSLRLRPESECTMSPKSFWPCARSLAVGMRVTFQGIA